MSEESKNIFTLHRYYIWANKMRDHFYEILNVKNKKSDTRKKIVDIESFMYMSLWYGLIYVVIEGWEELNLKDEIIETLLLKKKYVKLLKRYRNGVFHFKKKYLDNRFVNFDKEKEAAGWVYNLNKEFGRFFLEKLQLDPSASASSRKKY